jgi:hypothetical protein
MPVYIFVLIAKVLVEATLLLLAPIPVFPNHLILLIRRGIPLITMP